MMGHNIHFEGLYGKLSLNYPFYPILSGALMTFCENIHDDQKLPYKGMACILTRMKRKDIGYFMLILSQPVVVQKLTKK